MPIYFEKLIMMGLMPFILCGLSLGFWYIISLLQKRHLREYRGKVISTLIVILFIVHPIIAKSMFVTFNCIDIDGVYRMIENIDNICYEGQHLFFISTVAFPSIGVWVVGIPLTALVILVKNRRVMSLMA